jgi:ATP-dependent Lon protease
MRIINPKITNSVFYIAITVSIYNLLQLYLARRSLPAGMCPVDGNSAGITLSLTLIFIYFVMTFFTVKE